MLTYMFFLIQITFFSWFLYLLFAPRSSQLQIKQINLIFSFVVLLEIIVLGISTMYNSSSDSAVAELALINSPIQLSYTIVIDTYAYLFMLLSAYLIPLCFISSWNNIKFLLSEFLLTIAIVEWMLINMFMVTDILLYYVWFEAILLPMYILIGVWGSRQRKTYASFMFFFYTFVGSLFMLYALVMLYSQYNTLNLFGLIDKEIANSYMLWLLFIIAFAVKVPMFPAHIWLPEAHVEAPTVGSVLLAGVLLKLGIFAVIRFIIPIFPEETQYYAPLIAIFALLGILYISLTTIRQTDLKKIIAYASVAHMNYVVLGVFGTNTLSFAGSIFLMIGHGIVSAGLFFMIGFMYDRYKTRNIRYYRGMVAFMPIYAFMFLVLTLANMSFPGTCNFVGEALILLGLAQSNLLVCWLAAIGIVFCAIYSIWLFNRTMYGPITPMISTFSDLSKKEFTVVLPLIALTLLLGIFPNTLLTLLQENIILYYYQ